MAREFQWRPLPAPLAKVLHGECDLVWQRLLDNTMGDPWLAMTRYQHRETHQSILVLDHGAGLVQTFVAVDDLRVQLHAEPPGLAQLRTWLDSVATDPTRVRLRESPPKVLPPAFYADPDVWDLLGNIWIPVFMVLVLASTIALLAALSMIYGGTP